MSLATTKPRVGLAVSSHPVLRPARACRTTICRSGPADTHVSRRESLSLLIALPLFASTGAAQAVDLGDFRKVKRRLLSDQPRGTSFTQRPSCCQLTLPVLDYVQTWCMYAVVCDYVNATCIHPLCGLTTTPCDELLLNRKSGQP